MVYLDERVIDPVSIAKTFVRTEIIEKNQEAKDFAIEYILNRLEGVFNKLMAYIRKHGTEPISTINNSVMKTLLNLLKAICEFDVQWERIDEENYEKVMNRLLIFCIAWSVACTCDLKTANRFEQQLTQNSMFSGNDMPKSQLFDSFVCFSQHDPDWMKWESLLQEFEYSMEKRWTDLIVKTKNTIRYSYLLKMAISN